MNKVKIGVVGVGRGSSMIKYCEKAQNAEVVAICDSWEEGLMRKKAELKDDRITYYTSFDQFLKHGTDAVILANYANEHAPFAIKCLKAGKHVLSEVLPCQTMQEAVELVEAVEETGKIYSYSENYCFMPAPKEMRRLYREGKLGEFQYGEGEYVHNCETIWPACTHGDPDHWRNTMYATFYCTHSIGPLLHITGLRPVKVSGFELPFDARAARMGCQSGAAGLELITLENGAVIKSLHGCLGKNSIWYSIYGSKGRMESAREDAAQDDTSRLYINLDHFEGENLFEPTNVKPTDEHTEQAASMGHGGSDFYTMYHFVDKILGNNTADIIDVYEALNMFLPGMFAYRSVLNGGIPMEIPDLRKKAIRDQYRDDRMCTDPKTAGDQLIPSYSKGVPEIAPQVYQLIREKWLKSLEKN